jgi:histidinol dehydrogenase
MEKQQGNQSVLTRLDSRDTAFTPALDALLARERVSNETVERRVKAILEQIRASGDAALVELSNRFDGLAVSSMGDLTLGQQRLQQALVSLPAEKRQALELAAGRIRQFHERQKSASWQYREADGSLLGQQVTPMERVGIYVPGGKATYPSSVLMNAIPAQVAGVKEIVMVVPTPGGVINALVLAAAALAGVQWVFTIGGAQAIAALAYGTASVPRVDKIVGPGNVYVATAKRLVFGQVGIDMIAGPSEILIVCDGKTHPDWVAMDLFSQAEHDENAQSILISPDADFLQQVEAAVHRLLPGMPREAIIRQSLQTRGAMIHVTDLQEAARLVNRIAPEHLELSVEDPEALLPLITHAGAIFMGRYTAEVVGDYCAGPNHVLPTSGTARFSSPLGVYDFEKRSSLIMMSPEGASRLGSVAAQLARDEGLEAHARSAEYRISSR